MMHCPLPLLLALCACATLAAPAADPLEGYDYPEVVVPQKRAALVLDRLLVALQRALRDDADPPAPRLARPPRRDEPRAAPLRLAHIDDTDMGALPIQTRRGQGNGPQQGRVLRCYFNAVTCF